MLIRVSLLILMACFAFLFQGAQEDFRKWKSSDGKHTTEARLVKVDGEWVKLENKDGKQIKLKRSRLSRHDQDFIRDHEGADKTKKPRAIPKGRLTKIEKSSIFARDVLAAYQAAMAEAADADKPLLDSKIKEFTKLAAENAINFGDRFVPEKNIPGLRADAEQLVAAWFEAAQDLNSRIRLGDLEKVSSIDPISTDAAIFLGLHYVFHERDYGEAARHFKDAIKRGTKYRLINGAAENQNLVCALNNQALLEVRSNNPARACDYWNKAADIDPSLDRRINYNIAKTGRFLDKLGEYGVSASNAVRKRYVKLVAKTETSNLGRDGWYFMLPMAQNGEPYQRCDFLVGFEGKGVRVHSGYLEDQVCLRCNGRGQLRCTNRSCKNGYVTTIEPGRMVYNGRQLVPVPAKTHVNKCNVCNTKQVISCFSCGGSGSQANR